MCRMAPQSERSTEHRVLQQRWSNTIAIRHAVWKPVCLETSPRTRSKYQSSYPRRFHGVTSSIFAVLSANGPKIMCKDAKFGGSNGGAQGERGVEWDAESVEGIR